MGVRGCLSLAIVWTQFLSRCIDHRQGVAEGGQAGNMRGGGFRVVIDTGGRSEHIAYFLCMWTADRKAGGPWRALQRKRKRKSWSGWGFAPVVWRSVPSPAHVHDEVMRDPGPLTNSGQMGRGFFPTITLQQRALEPVQLLLYGEKIITGFFRRILNQHCFTAHCTVWRISLKVSAVLSSSIHEYSIQVYCHVSTAPTTELQSWF